MENSSGCARNLSVGHARYSLLLLTTLSHLQVLFDHLVGQRGDRAGDDDRAAVHGVVAVGDFAAEIDVLLDEQDGEGAFAL